MRLNILELFVSIIVFGSFFFVIIYLDCCIMRYFECYNIGFVFFKVIFGFFLFYKVMIKKGI